MQHCLFRGGGSSLCSIVLIDPTKNKIKDNQRTSMNERNTILYKNIYLQSILEKEHTICCKLER